MGSLWGPSPRSSLLSDADQVYLWTTSQEIVKIGRLCVSRRLVIHLWATNKANIRDGLDYAAILHTLVARCILKATNSFRIFEKILYSSSLQARSVSVLFFKVSRRKTCPGRRNEALRITGVINEVRSETTNTRRRALQWHARRRHLVSFHDVRFHSHHHLLFLLLHDPFP